MAGGPIEQKAAAGPVATLVGGYAAAILIAYVPVLRDAFPADERDQLAVFCAFVLSALAAYYAPHTHRPDLAAVQEARGRRHAAEEAP